MTNYNQVSSPEHVIMLPVSGGLDSTCLLYEYLNTNRRVYPFHVQIENQQEPFKYIHEKMALKSIMEYVYIHFPLCSPIKIAKYDHNDFGFGRDSEIIYLTAQKLAYELAERDDVKYIQLSEAVVADDLEIAEYRNRNNLNIDCKIWKTFVESMIFRISDEQHLKVDPVLRLPYKNTRKSELILGNTPIDMIEHTFWCRKPVGGKPCNKCRSCIIYENALQEVQKSAMAKKIGNKIKKH